MSTGRTAGRPRQFDVDTALDQSLELFWRNGFAATTTRMLVAELELTPSSMYNAFGSKSDLMEAVLDKYVARLEDGIVARLDRPDAGTPELVQFLSDLVEWISGDNRQGCLLLNLLAESGTNDPKLVGRATAYRNRLRAVFTNALSHHGAAAAVARAEALLAGVLGLNIAARGGADRAELDRMADALGLVFV